MNANHSPPKIYTKTGDKGKTTLIGGQRVAKSHLRLETYGTVDELNSLLGLLILEASSELYSPDELVKELTTIQKDLFDIGSHLACEDQKIRESLPPLEPDRVLELEKQIDLMTASLVPLKNFILPGGSRTACWAHVARTVCRRAERACVRMSETGNDDDKVDKAQDVVVTYLNRLSDLLFTLARWANHQLKIEEPIWSGRQ